MPHDLFDDVTVRSTSARGRRSSVAVLTVLSHIAILAALIIAPLVASDALPAIWQIGAPYVVPSNVMPILPPPAPRLARSGAKTAPGSGTSFSASTDTRAPVEPPIGISPESEARAGVPGGDESATLGISGGVEFGASIRMPPPPTPTPSPQPVRVFEGFNMPRKIVDVQPVYPALAQQARIEGIVIIDATIDTQGHVVGARVLRSVPMLDKAALDAVNQWAFTPTRLNGRIVPVVLTVTVRFTLQR